MSATTAVQSAPADRLAFRTAFASDPAVDGDCAAWTLDDRTLDRLRVLNLLWDEQAVRTALEARDAAIPAVG